MLLEWDDTCKHLIDSSVYFVEKSLKMENKINWVSFNFQIVTINEILHSIRGLGIAEVCGREQCKVMRSHIYGAVTRLERGYRKNTRFSPLSICH